MTARPIHALAAALGVVEHHEQPGADQPTVDVAGAAALLHTSKGSIYMRRARGLMPRPLSRRPLVWRTADVLAMKG